MNFKLPVVLLWNKKNVMELVDTYIYGSSDYSVTFEEQSQTKIRQDFIPLFSCRTLRDTQYSIQTVPYDHFLIFVINSLEF